MRAHYLQHIPFEGLGSVETWLKAAGAEIKSTRLFESAKLPTPEDVDLLIVLGGPMSVNEEGDFPWLVEEKRLIRDCVQAGKSVLGICLGAQLIASAMGAPVYHNRAKEIGWFPVYGVPSLDRSMFCFPPSLEVFHWHGETFDLPPGSIRIARSQACENQAFQLNPRVIGLQFHLETTPESAQTMVSHCGAELTPAEYVQSGAAILAAEPGKYRTINSLMAQVLSHIRPAAHDPKRHHAD